MTGELAVVGGGLIGLATARAYLEERPGADVVVFEKESRLASHQSGNNSGVIHSGLYYRPGSLKAELAVAGAEEMYRFVEEEQIPFDRSGKLVVAVTERELPALEELERRGNANGLIGLRRIGPEEITEIEPTATGIAALHVPDAGVTDYVAVAERLAARLQEQDVVIRRGSPLTAIRETSDHVEVVVGGETHRFRNLVNCAGLHSDRIAALGGIRPEVRIVPFRGEYFTLTGPLAERVRASIYPVPDPRYPFLGVHFTRAVDGSVHVGPNAVLALGREQYRGRPPSLRDLWEMARFGGFWRLAAANVPAGAREMASRWRRLYARQARRLVPGVRAGHLARGRAGIRAQAVDRYGKLVDDFVIERSGRSVHVLNAPSPGATASLAIGRHIAKVIAGGTR